ncbi:mitochondrial enolase superfamily member 1-like [Cimex lectularius]|uniref:Mitochondrial enolase superfamily member 1 n=1 Tax=Cimex lectularius TaxID=79782 RepID=A0A8I6RNF9_CIMLE|nr:mitochondrial enolase superfamily member 1-like [Cimex lectularius]
MNSNLIITDLEVKDVRFPTSLYHDGSDAMHKNPDYSCAYVILHTTGDVKGHGLTFTLGKGTEVVISGIKALSSYVIGESIGVIFKDFSSYWRKLTSDSQLRWIGPEKGVMHLATAAIINALWDLWGRIESKPVWKLLSDLSPEQLVSVIDFRYITDVISKEEAVQMLKDGMKERPAREAELLTNGYPAYTTQAGWIGYSDEKVRHLCRKYLGMGFDSFKIKVGQDLESDKHRCRLVRNAIGPDKNLMVDANQVWDVNQAIEWMKELAQFKPLWIEEPTSPDDILGHATIAKALKEYNIGVASGEMCCNRVMFKQLLQSQAVEFCQIDSARIGGVNEILSVYLMAKKLGVKVCPHAGGVGLCEMVQHLQYWDYICLSGTKDSRWIEFVDQQHEHFKDPALVIDGNYILPKKPGYSTEMHEEALRLHEFPVGQVWEKISCKC